MFRGENIYLREITPDDLDLVLNWENNPENWKVSSISKAYSLDQIKEFVNLPQDIFLNNQLRMIVCLVGSNEVVGNVDLFDFEPEHQRIGVGVLIDQKYRGKGLAVQSIALLEEYCSLILGVKNVFCNILTDNKSSVKVFELSGYELVGVKKGWHLYQGQWFDEFLYQKRI